MSASPSPSQEPPHSPKKSNDARNGWIVLITMLVLVVGGCQAIFSGGDDEPKAPAGPATAVPAAPQTPATRAKFSAGVDDITVVDPADVSVSFHVANTGSKAGTPTCTVRAQNPSGAYSGFDGGEMDSAVQPGQTIHSALTVIITHQGASYVTQASVDCN